MDIFKSIVNIGKLFKVFSLNPNGMKVISSTGTTILDLRIKSIPRGYSAAAHSDEEIIEFYQVMEGEGILHIVNLTADNQHNKRKLLLKTGDTLIFKPHRLQKIENSSEIPFVIIFGHSSTNDCTYTAEGKDIKLTDRQLQVLFFLLRGKTIKQIAPLLNLSSRTIDDYLNQLRIKFSVQTKYELTDKAIRQGYFNIIPESLLKTPLKE